MQLLYSALDCPGVWEYNCKDHKLDRQIDLIGHRSPVTKQNRTLYPPITPRISMGLRDIAGSWPRIGNPTQKARPVFQLCRCFTTFKHGRSRFVLLKGYAHVARYLSGLHQSRFHFPCLVLAPPVSPGTLLILIVSSINTLGLSAWPPPISR